MAGKSQRAQPVAKQRVADEYLAGKSGHTDKVSPEWQTKIDANDSDEALVQVLTSDDCLVDVVWLSPWVVC